MENNSSYIEAKAQLDKMFKKQTDFRHIIFWYDPQKDFIDEIKNDSFENAKIVMYNNNPFSLKVLLEIEDTTSNYLLYFSCEKPKDIDNWLLDILLYSEEYYADITALTMRKLGLETSNLRGVINEHLTFFDSKERINQLQKRINITDKTSQFDFEMAMMGVLTKAEYDKIDYIVKELIFEFENGKKYKDLDKYNFKNTLWNLIGEHYYYSGIEDIESLAKSLLVTAVDQNKFLIFDSPQWKNMIIKNSSEAACYFVNEILKKDKRYAQLQESLAISLRISDLISSKGIDSLRESDEFKVFDSYIIKTISKALVNGSYDFDFYLKVINDFRLTTKWYEDFKNEYEFLKYSILLKKNANISIEPGLLPQDYINEYCENYYVVDNYYRHAINEYSKISEPYEYETLLVNDVDNTYENTFLSKLGGEYSRSLMKIQPSYDFGSVELSKYFYKNKVNRPVKKQFVIISDALRYEVAVDLLRELNNEKSFKGGFKLEHQVTTLPSITSFGMASLLPNEKISYKDKQVYVDDMPTNTTEARNKVLKKYSNSYAAIQYENIMKMNVAELRAYMSDKSCLYIYHDTIDNAGEHDFDVFEACNKAVKEIFDCVKKIYNTLQTSFYTITSDHGFIYRNKKIDESLKYPTLAPLGLDDYSQRYAIISDNTELNDSNVFDMNYLNDCNMKVYTPYSYDLYRKQGGGIQYIHGGASIQEMVTPIISSSGMFTINALLSEPAKVRLKSTNRKIMNKSFSLQFEQCEKVEGKKREANLIVYFVDENNNIVSEEKVIIANKTTDNISERTIDVRFLLKNEEFSRNKRYFLVMKDADTGDIISDDTQFIIDIVKFKMF